MCGRVVTEDVPWARARARHTIAFEQLVAWWTQRCDRTTVAAALRVDWETVTTIIGRVVAEELTDARFDHLTRLGVDEISYAKGHQFLTVVVDQTTGATLWVGEGKSAATLGSFYELLGPERCQRIEAVSMDMGRAYPAATLKATRAAICWDPFHAVKLLNKAVTDTIRWVRLTKTGLPLSGGEARDLRWALLKKPTDLTDNQAAVLQRHERSHHAIWRAQQIKERFRGLYQLDNPTDVAAYLERWLKTRRSVRNSRGTPVELGLSKSRIVGTNSKIRLSNHRGYGHHRAATFIPIIYLACGNITTTLPWEPQPTPTSP